MNRLRFVDPGDTGAVVSAAAEVVAGGGVVLIPTESFYGLGVDPSRSTAVEKVYALKGRPAGLALPVVCSDWQQLEALVRIPAVHRKRLARIWPAALTVVAPCIRPVAASGGDTLAVRIPGHAMLRALLYRVGPLTATSANRHGDPGCVDVEAALASLIGAPDLVLDAGELAGGGASTIVDLTTDVAREIRPGPVPWDRPFDLESWSVREL